MRNLALLVLLVGGLALAGGGLPLDTSHRVQLTNCPSAGSTTLSDAGIADGGSGALKSRVTYLMRVLDDDVTVCLSESAAPSCTSGGEPFPRGTVVLLSMPNAVQAVSCRSNTDAGDVYFTLSP